MAKTSGLGARQRAALRLLVQLDGLLVNNIYAVERVVVEQLVRRGLAKRLRHTWVATDAGRALIEEWARRRRW